MERKRIISSIIFVILLLILLTTIIVLLSINCVNEKEFAHDSAIKHKRNACEIYQSNIGYGVFVHICESEKGKVLVDIRLFLNGTSTIKGIQLSPKQFKRIEFKKINHLISKL